MGRFAALTKRFFSRILARTEPLLPWCMWAALGLLAGACTHRSEHFALRTTLAAASSVTGSVSVERVEGGIWLIVVELSQLPPPERIAPGLGEFVVWLRAPNGTYVRAGTLEYNREHRAGSLFTTTNLSAFTLQVAAEREFGARAPGGVILAERAVTTR